jgi:hypothetical protein
VARDRLIGHVAELTAACICSGNSIWASRHLISATPKRERAASVLARPTGEQPATATPSVVLTPLNGGTTWVVTFASNSDATVIGHSIADGIYTATLNSSLVTAVSGGATMTTTRPTDTFYRLFGDYLANGRVNSTDNGTLNLSFGLNYLSSSGYLDFFDYLGTGRVYSTDSGELNLNFGSYWRNINATI